MIDEANPTVVRSSTTTVTSKWGDLVGAFDATFGFWTAPDGTVNVTSDILAMLETFQSTPGFPRKVRIDVEPAIPNGVVNILDVVFVLDAFRGLPYPFQPGQAPCG